MSGCCSSRRKSWRLFSSRPSIQERTVEQIVDISVPQIMEKNCGSSADHTTRARAESLGGADRGRAHSPDQEEIVEVIQLIPQEGISERNLEQIVEVPVPQIEEQIVEVVKIIPQERVLRWAERARKHLAAHRGAGSRRCCSA